MQRIGVIGVVGAFAVGLTLSANAEESCRDLYAGKGQSEGQPEQGDRLYLSDSQCEAAAKHELRLSLFEIPQEDENPKAVAIGLRQGVGILRVREQFSV